MTQSFLFNPSHSSSQGHFGEHLWGSNPIFSHRDREASTHWFFFLSLRAFIQQRTSHQWSWVGLSCWRGGGGRRYGCVGGRRGCADCNSSLTSTFPSRVPLSLVPLREVRRRTRSPLFFSVSIMHRVVKFWPFKDGADTESGGLKACLWRPRCRV